MGEDAAKEFLMGYVRARRREVSLKAALRQCDPESDAETRAQLEEEVSASYAIRDRIHRAADRLPGAERDIVIERYLSPAPIRHGGLVVGWRLKGWDEIAASWGYSRRHIMRLHKAALRQISDR